MYREQPSVCALGGCVGACRQAAVAAAEAAAAAEAEERIYLQGTSVLCALSQPCFL